MILKTIHQNVNLREDIGVIKQYVFLVLCHPRISVKELAHHLFLPVPIISAIKNELKKKNMIIDQSGIVATPKGELIIRQELKIEAIDIKRYLQVISMENCHELIQDSHAIYQNRPEVDVTIDQSKCTTETAFKRACYLLQKREIITGSLLCIGDDDLVSVACAFLYDYITHGKGKDFHVTVVDKDNRISDYITKISQAHQLPITCISHDLIDPMPKALSHKFDSMITDPPYTLNGLQLFITRGLTCLKKNIEVSIFLSYPHKPLADRLNMQQFLTANHLVIDHMKESFNHYEGAQIIGGVSNFYQLKTIIETELADEISFTKKIYTREQNPKNRKYQCMQCQRIYQVGRGQKFTTIEQLKNTTCENCSHTKFKLLRNTNSSKKNIHDILPMK